MVEKDNLLSPTNYLSRMLPASNDANVESAKRQIKEKDADDEGEEVEDSAEKVVYTMFLRSGEPNYENEQQQQQKVTLEREEIDVESSGSSSQETQEESITPIIDENGEGEIIDVEKLPSRRKLLRLDKQRRREKTNPSPSSGKRGGHHHKRQPDLVDSVHHQDPMDNIASLWDGKGATTTTSGAATWSSSTRSGLKNRQQKATKRGRKTSSKPEAKKRPRFDSGDDDEYSTVYVGGSSDEEREAERLRRIEQGRKEAEEMRSFRKLLKAGAHGASPEKEVEIIATATSDKDPSRSAPLLRLPYTVNSEAFRTERKERAANVDYARVEVVRKKDERAMLPGHECEECAKVCSALCSLLTRNTSNNSSCCCVLFFSSFVFSPPHTVLRCYQGGWSGI